MPLFIVHMHLSQWEIRDYPRTQKGFFMMRNIKSSIIRNFIYKDELRRVYG